MVLAQVTFAIRSIFPWFYWQYVIPITGLFLLMLVHLVKHLIHQYIKSLLFKKKKKMQDNTPNIPDARPASPNGDPQPFVLVGDEAFLLSTHMMRPYGGKYLSEMRKHLTIRYQER